MSTAGLGQTSPSWWLALPPAQTEVQCGEQTHRLLWRDGRLTALDHPDAEGELVLAALGGDRSKCLDLAESWAGHSDDLEVLAAGPRSRADELTIRPDNIDGLRAGGGWRAYAPLRAGPPPLPLGLTALHVTRHRPPMARRATSFGAFTPAMPRPPAAARRHRRISAHSSVVIGRSQVRPGRRPAHDDLERDAARRAELLSVLALGTEFQFRLSATVAAAWAAGGTRAADRGAARPALVAALAGRLAPAAESWLGIDPGRVDVSLHEDAGWGRVAMSGTGTDRRLSAALPVGWLASVWAAGLAVTAGHLIVAVTEAAWPDATVLGVPEPGAEPVTLKVRATAREWRATPAADGHGSGAR
jgi:hypothetical protein